MVHASLARLVPLLHGCQTESMSACQESGHYVSSGYFYGPGQAMMMQEEEEGGGDEAPGGRGGEGEEGYNPRKAFDWQTRLQSFACHQCKTSKV